MENRTRLIAATALTLLLTFAVRVFPDVYLPWTRIGEGPGESEGEITSTWSYIASTHTRTLTATRATGDTDCNFTTGETESDTLKSGWPRWYCAYGSFTPDDTGTSVGYTAPSNIDIVTVFLHEEDTYDKADDIPNTGADMYDRAGYGQHQDHKSLYVYKIKLEKYGNTTISDDGNYSEDTHVKASVVAANSGALYSSFNETISVDIAETGTSCYASPGSMPSSISVGSGGTGTTATPCKSLVGPINSTTPPADSQVTTTNYPIYNASGWVALDQWTNDLGQVHLRSSGDVYDWFETRTKDIYTDASGDLLTVLCKVSSYDQTTGSYYGEIVDWDHTATTAVHYNPHYITTRRDTSGGTFCGQSMDHQHTYTVIHEARHCYQDYLSSQDLGQTDDIGGKPDNDDDQDWLVETIPIGPTTYLPDTGTSRSKCTGTDSFSGDGTYDDYASGGTRSATDNVIEKDAAKYADDND